MAWQEIFDKLMDPVDWLREEKITKLKEMSNDNAREISDILIGISTGPIEKTYYDFGDFVYLPKFKNIKTNEDLVREEFRGALQRYIMGFFDDSIIHACFSVEAALLVTEDNLLKRNKLNEKDIHHPFTLGINIKVATKSEQKFIRDKEIVNKLNKIRIIRNSIIHQFNFISTLTSFYKLVIEEYEFVINQIKDVEKIIENEQLEKFIQIAKNLAITMIPEYKSRIETLSNIKNFKMLIEDVNNGIEAMKKLSDFKWSSDKENKKFINSKIIEYKNNIFHYLALETLQDSFHILHHLKYF